MKLKSVCEISLRFQPPNTITTHLHSFKTITRFPLYSPSSSQLPRLIILFLLKKLVGTSILKIELKIMSREKERPPIIRVRLLKKKRRKVKVDPKFGGQWKEKEKVLCLVANERRKRRFFSTSSHFPPKQLYLDLHFLPLDIKVLLYHGPRPLFTHSLPFPWPINYACVS
jgi:hypothetical protein